MHVASTMEEVLLGKTKHREQERKEETRKHRNKLAAGHKLYQLLKYAALYIKW
jgi:hypothetical protein